LFICSNCSKNYSKWQGRCDQCGAWNTIVEVEAPKIKLSGAKGSRMGKKSMITNESSKPVKLSELNGIDASGGDAINRVYTKGSAHNSQLVTGITEFDNTVGGHLLPGQVVLLSGSPGVGKSTLSLQLTESLSKQGLSVLYIAGEESPSQIKQRADRLKLKQENVSFMPETNITNIESFIASHEKDIDILFVDSIQTLFDPSINSSSGSVSQVSESTNRIVNLAKGFGITTFIIGHITKTGDIAGPKILEHMVDTVLYFEGDRKYEFRVLRVEKNRYGPTDEAGIFKMTLLGLEEVKDTKELLDRNKEAVPGSVYALVMEGTRPVVVEVQALATKTYFTNPRRTTSGFDSSRLYILLALIDKQLKLKTYEYDVYVNITGGIKISDPALDLAVIKAITSSIKNETVPRENIYFGEVGLTGEVRKVFMEEKRLKEAKRLGFSNIYYSKSFPKIKEVGR
jgi:DNA repair protein RadA/Sms